MWDFLNNMMSPLHTAMSFVITYAYRFWSMITGPDLGLTWALAIMSLTIIVRSLLIPLFVRQINSSRNMQLIQPKMKELQDKYGADRERLGRETQKLMKDEGVSPAASCLPMLLQMPVFFALYQVLYAAANNQAKGYFFTHHPELLESLYNSRFLGAALAGRFWEVFQGSPFGATQVVAIILVLLMSSLLFLTQKQLMGKNMPPDALKGPMAQQQKMMLYLFPFMYIFMGAYIPVGVLVYWATNNTWTFVQQFLLIRNNPTPGTPAYIDWEERMIKQGKDPKALAEQRRTKRRRKPPETPAGRTVRGAGPTTPGAGNGAAAEVPGDGTATVQRQQIQRQQPARQSRSGRTIKKK
ncbi:MAG: membrane protein insertase YidC [Propionibacteriaceae bacterium]|jgi:YidC/Oxa1 family membrane protein insertase|nr:membrane protein insertase YidC [Propionibacteriaceae bacterium]